MTLLDNPSLSQILLDNKPEIKPVVDKLNLYTEQLKAGELSSDEYKDICKDTLNLDEITKDVEDLKRVEEIKKVIQILECAVELAASA